MKVLIKVDVAKHSSDLIMIVWLADDLGEPLTDTSNSRMTWMRRHNMRSLKTIKGISSESLKLGPCGFFGMNLIQLVAKCVVMADLGDELSGLNKLSEDICCVSSTIADIGQSLPVGVSGNSSEQIGMLVKEILAERLPQSRTDWARNPKESENGVVE
jgi:hypothetical protein